MPEGNHKLPIISRKLRALNIRRKIYFGFLILFCAGLVFSFISGRIGSSLAKASLAPQGAIVNGKNAQFDQNSEPDFIVDTADTISSDKAISASGKLDMGLSSITADAHWAGDGEQNQPEIIAKGTSSSDQFEIRLDKNQFRPGKYDLNIELSTFGNKQKLTQTFIWGVLAVNSNKLIYSPGEIAYLQISAVNDNGHTLCDAPLKLEVKSPDGQIQNFTVGDGTISKSGECSMDNVTDKPDYFVNYQVAGAGDYQMTLTNTDNNYSTTSSFSAEDNPLFEIERVNATRINPFKASYKMTINIKANQDLNSSIKEKIPASFEISEISGNGAVSDKNDNTQTISWPETMNSGDTVSLSYRYQAPPVSPEFYLLGPLEIFAATIGSDGGAVSESAIFAESHQWQIAADATCTLTTAGTWDGDVATDATLGNSGTARWTGCTAGVGYTPSTTDSITIGSAQTLTLIAGTSTPTVASISITAMAASGTNGITIGANTFNVGNIAIGGSSTSGRYSQVNMNNASSIVNCTGAVSYTGTAAQARVNFTANGTFNVTGNFLPGALVGTTVGTVNANGSGAQSLGAFATYYNLSLNNTAAAGTYVTFAGTATINGALTVTNGNLDFSTRTVTVTGATSVTDVITSTGVSTTTFASLVTVNAGGSFNMSVAASASTFRGGITNASANAFKTGTGTTTFNTTAAQNLSGSGAGGIVISGATTLASGIVVTNNTSSQSVTFGTAAGGGTITCGSATAGITTTGGSDTIFMATGTNTCSAGVLTPAATAHTIEYNYNGAQTMKAPTTNNYWHVKFGGTSGAKTDAAAGDTINGDLTIGGGTSFAGGTSLTHTFKGNWIVNTTIASTPFTYSTGSTINFNTPGTPAATSITGTSTQTIAFNIVNVNNTSGFSISTAGAPTTTPISANGAFTVAGSVTCTNNGTTTLSNSLAGAGGFTNAGTATLNYSSTTTIAITTLTATAASNTVNYSGAAQTCYTTQYYHLRFSGTTTKTCTPTSPILGNLTIAGTTAAWTMTTLVTVNGNLSVQPSGAGGLTTGGAAFTVTGTTSVSGGTLSLTNNTGAKTFTGMITVTAGTLSGASTNIIFVAGLTHNTGGTVSITGTVTMSTLNGTIVTDVASSITALTMNTASAFTTSGSNTLTVTTFTVTSPAVVTNSGTVTVSTSLTGTGNFTNGNGTNGTLNLNFTGTPGITTLTANAANNTVSYGFAGTQTVKVPASGYYNLTLTSSGAKTMTSVTSILGDLTISSTATMTLNAAFDVAGTLNYSSASSTTLTNSTNIIVGIYNQTAGTIIDNGVQITVDGTGASVWTMTGTFTASGTVVFTGASPQIGASNFNNLTISVGTSATLTGAADVNGNFSLTTGTFNCNSQNQNFAGNFSLTLGTTYTKGGTLTFDKAGSQDVADATAASGQDLGTVTIGPATTTTVTTSNKIEVTDLTIGADDTLNISDDTLTVAGNFTNSGALTSTSSTVVFSAASPNIQTVDAGGTAANKALNHVTHSGTGTMQLNSTGIDINGVFTNSNGTFDANNLDVNVADDFLVSGGSFTPKNGGGATTQTVTFDSTTEATISGSTTFRNLTMNTTTDGPKTIKFTAGTTQTIPGTWTLDGDVGKVLTLRSTSDTNAWFWTIGADINPSGDYIDVKDSQSTNAYRITAGSNCTNSGNNTPGWIFNHAPNSPSSLAQKKVTGGATISTGGWTNETQVQFTATASDSDNPDTLYLCVEKDFIATALSSVDGGDLCGSGVAYSGTPVTVSVTITDMTDANEYHWQAQVKDAAGAYSSFVGYGGNTENPPTNPADRDYGIDNSEPTGGTVYDGNDGSEHKYNSGSLSAMSGYWAASEPNFGISGKPTTNVYEYAIGTTSGGTNTKSWTYTGTSGTDAFIDSTGLSLRTGQTYYVSLKAHDAAGNTSTPITSAGQAVAPTLTFSYASGSSITFNELNSGNSWTDSTQTTVLRTSTNAYSGYVVRARATGKLTMASNPTYYFDHYGSPNSAPTTWSGTGFGYTTDDSSLTGPGAADRFTNGGPKFAGFTETGPGDPVADHTANVSGTPITDEDWTITYRVTGNATTAAGTYTTTIVYTCIPQY